MIGTDFPFAGRMAAPITAATTRATLKIMS